MTQDSEKDPRDIPLNPALKSERETIYQTKVSSPAPIETTSASVEDGKGWPLAWLLVTIGGIALAIYFLI